MSQPELEPKPLADAAARRGRNIALAVALLLFVVIVFAVTIVRLGGGHAG